MTYKDMVACGQSHEESSRKAKLVEATTNRSEDKLRKLEDKLTQTKARKKNTFKCQT